MFLGKTDAFSAAPRPHMQKSHGIYHDILVNYNMEKHFCFVYHREQRVYPPGIVLSRMPAGILFF